VKQNRKSVPERFSQLLINTSIIKTPNHHQNQKQPCLSSTPRVSAVVTLAPTSRPAGTAFTGDLGGSALASSTASSRTSGSACKEEGNERTTPMALPLLVFACTNGGKGMGLGIHERESNEER
jgi:hypothetical protein